MKENKTPLFDRIFKPKTIMLSNGHTVNKPVSRTPFIVGCVILAIIVSIEMTGFDLRIIDQIFNCFAFLSFIASEGIKYLGYYKIIFYLFFYFFFVSIFIFLFYKN